MTLQFDVGYSTIAHMSMIDCMLFCGRVRILSGACPSFDWLAACCTHGTRSASWARAKAHLPPHALFQLHEQTVVWYDALQHAQNTSTGRVLVRAANRLAAKGFYHTRLARAQSSFSQLARVYHVPGVRLLTRARCAECAVAQWLGVHVDTMVLSCAPLRPRRPHYHRRGRCHVRVSATVWQPVTPYLVGRDSCCTNGEANKNHHHHVPAAPTWKICPQAHTVWGG